MFNTFHELDVQYFSSPKLSVQYFPLIRMSVCRGGMYIQKRKNLILKYNFHFPTWTYQDHQIIMGGHTNLFTLSESAINSTKKLELVKTIIDFKGKVIVDFDKQISMLNEAMSQLHSASKKYKWVPSCEKCKLLTWRKDYQSPKKSNQIRPAQQPQQCWVFWYSKWYLIK